MSKCVVIPARELCENTRYRCLGIVDWLLAVSGTGTIVGFWRAVKGVLYLLTLQYYSGQWFSGFLSLLFTLTNKTPSYPVFFLFGGGGGGQVTYMIQFNFFFLFLPTPLKMPRDQG